MSFVINTTVDKNQELLDAYKELYENGVEKDVFLISKNVRIDVDSFALALSSDFFKKLLSENQRDTVNIVIPDIDPSILQKVVEYIYNGSIVLEPKYMSDFIEACNLLQLKATISCERNLTFDKPSEKKFSAKITSTPVNPSSSKTTNLNTLISELESEDQIDYEVKPEQSEDSSQIMEVYEISNLEDAEITYEEGDCEENEMSEEGYELVNVISDVKESEDVPKPKRFKKSNYTDIKPRLPTKPVDEETMRQALDEVITHSTSFRVVSEKYQIPKTLLWRRAKKEGYIKGEKQKEPARLEAIEEIKRGESLISLSRKYSIPISTLHREKIKLYEKGQLPENVMLKNRSRGEDYEDRLRVAITEILNGKSQNEVAKKYNIPKTTIWRIIKKVDPLYRENTGHANITPDSEVVDHMIQMAKRRMVKEDPLEETYDEEQDTSKASGSVKTEEF